MVHIENVINSETSFLKIIIYQIVANSLIFCFKFFGSSYVFFMSSRLGLFSIVTTKL